MEAVRKQERRATPVKTPKCYKCDLCIFKFDSLDRFNAHRKHFHRVGNLSLAEAANLAAKMIKKERAETGAATSAVSMPAVNVKIEGVKSIKSEVKTKKEGEKRKVIKKVVVKKLKIMAAETTCRLCTMKVPKNIFRKHLQYFHDKQPIRQSTEKYICGFCKSKFYTYYSYEDHYGAAHEPWLWGDFLDPFKRDEAIGRTPECPECPPAVRKNTKYLTWFDVQTHMRVAHGLRPRPGYNEKVVTFEVEEEVEYEEENGDSGLDASPEQIHGDDDEIQLVCVKKKAHSMAPKSLTGTQDEQQAGKSSAPTPDTVLEDVSDEEYDDMMDDDDEAALEEDISSDDFDIDGEEDEGETLEIDLAGDSDGERCYEGRRDERHADEGNDGEELLLPEDDEEEERGNDDEDDQLFARRVYASFFTQ